MTENSITKDIPLFLYNTETRSKQQLKPLADNHIRMYTCGPTVYHYAHIGNFRTYVFEDLLRRVIQFFGMKITQVMNLTDVDDKTIKGAIAQNVTLDEYTLPYKEAFFQDLKALNIQPAEHYPAATDYIPQMIKMIEGLLEKGVAYRGGDGSIYYAITKFPRYGCLSHLNCQELKAGASNRVSSDEYEKEQIADFVLWKKYDPARDGKIFWESPFGQGRPGWHLECSAMAMDILGETIDVHVGGIDNMFPHHENEIAQSEAYTGKSFVKLWMHSEHLIVNGKKMSKSLGNFFTLRDLLKQGYSGTELRYLLLQTHYKTQLNFTLAGLEAARETLSRLQNFICRMQEISLAAEEKEDKPHSERFLAAIKTCQIQFVNALADDLNISLALASIFDLVREINSLADKKELTSKEGSLILELLKLCNDVLGILHFENPISAIPPELEEALEKRIQARKDKDWALADTLRDFITNSGYLMEDTPSGTRLKKIEK